MSLWKKILGISKEETKIIKEPEHDLVNRSPDDLMVAKDKQDKMNGTAREDSLVQESKSSEDKEDLSNKDSP